jgi:hypothetical protein
MTVHMSVRHFSAFLTREHPELDDAAHRIYCDRFLEYYPGWINTPRYKDLYDWWEDLRPATNTDKTTAH